MRIGMPAYVPPVKFAKGPAAAQNSEGILVVVTERGPAKLLQAAQDAGDTAEVTRIADEHGRLLAMGLPPA